MSVSFRSRFEKKFSMSSSDFPSVSGKVKYIPIKLSHELIHKIGILCLTKNQNEYEFKFRFESLPKQSDYTEEYC